jgi:hypothetical protein
LWPLSIENPYSNSANDPAFLGETLQVASHLTVAQVDVRWTENRSIRRTGNHRPRLGCTDEPSSLCVHSDVRVKHNRVLRQVFQAFEQTRHVESGEIRKVQSRFVAVKTFSINCFQVFVERRNAAHHNRVSGARLELQGQIQGLRWLKYFPATGKVGVEREVVRLLLAGAAKNDWNPRKEFLMRVEHESDRRWSEGDDQVWSATLIFTDVRLSKLLLIRWIVEKGRLQILRI